MTVNTCRRCGASEIPTSEVRTIECAGELVRLCSRCHDELRDWFLNGIPDTAPELESEPAGR
jgi:hypothetical protein